jgi:hypothetical protein
MSEKEAAVIISRALGLDKTNVALGRRLVAEALRCSSDADFHSACSEFGSVDKDTATALFRKIKVR